MNDKIVKCQSCQKPRKAYQTVLDADKHYCPLCLLKKLKNEETIRRRS
jgi:late competence protein required for DNA uptake (superfamily II DNA/RNA helicase)